MPRRAGVLEVRSDDPSALDGIPAWSRLTGEELLAVVEEDGQPMKFYLHKKREVRSPGR